MVISIPWEGSNYGITASKTTMRTQMDECTRKCLTILGELIRDSVKKSKKTKRNVKMVTKIIKPFNDLNQLVDYISSESNISRKKANILLSDKSRNKILPHWFLKDYEKYRKEEIFHINHVRRCMDKIVPGESPNRHDYSKDELYFFITICAFNVKDEVCEVPSNVLDKIISDHHKTERHHPEFEKLNNEPLGEKDILEMVVDRLSRNLQFNQGRYNESQLIKFDPTFESNHENNINLYKTYINSLKTTVQETWREMKKVKNIK